MVSVGTQGFTWGPRMSLIPHNRVRVRRGRRQLSEVLVTATNLSWDRSQGSTEYVFDHISLREVRLRFNTRSVVLLHMLFLIGERLDY